MGIKSKEIKLSSIVIEKVKSRYYVNAFYTSEWGNFSSGLYNHIIDDVLEEMTYRKFRIMFKTYNGKFDKNSRIYFKSQEEADVFKEFLESHLIMNKLTE